MKTQIDIYKAARERLNAARLRGDDTDTFEEVRLRALWSMMSADDRRAAETPKLAA